MLAALGLVREQFSNHGVSEFLCVAAPGVAVVVLGYIVIRRLFRKMDRHLELAESHRQRVDATLEKLVEEARQRASDAAEEEGRSGPGVGTEGPGSRDPSSG